MKEIAEQAVAGLIIGVLVPTALYVLSAYIEHRLGDK